MKRLIVRPATSEDIVAFSDLSEPFTAKALVGEIDGRIVGMGGIALIKGRWYAFADFTEEARPYKMTIMRAAKRVMDDVRRSSIRFVYTVADPTEARSVAWLKSLGFEVDPRSMTFYRWSRKDRWQTQ
jgi:hypothetical protein